MSKISELSDGGSLVSSDYLIAVRSGGNVKVRMDQINVDQVDLGDNEFIRLGNSQDLTMVHTSTQSIINQAGIGDLLIQKAGTTKASITANGLEFPDNSKAIFGAGSDLQIYHDGGASRIVDAGTGIMTIQASSQLGIYNADGTQVSAEFVNDGKVGLRFNGSEKLATSASGVSVTGTVTADGATFSGPIQLTAGALAGAGNAGLSHRSADNKVYLQAGTGGFNILDDQQNTHVAIDSVGASTFYGTIAGPRISLSDGVDDAGSAGSESVFNNGGTTADFRVESSGNANMLFVDGGANRVGVGLSNPDTTLEVRNPTQATDTVNTSLTQRWSRLQTAATKWGNSMDLLLGSYESGTINSRTRVDFKLADGATDDPDTTVMTLQANGRVGVGVAAPNNTFDVHSSDTNAARIRGVNNLPLYSYHDSSGVGWSTGPNTSYGELIYMDPVSDKIVLYTGGSERAAFGASEIVFNNGGANQDFRVESDNTSAALFVDGTNGKVVLGGTTANANLYITKTTTGEVVRADNSQANWNGVMYYSVIFGTGNNNGSISADRHFQGYAGGTARFVVCGNGDVKNTNNSYGAISDLKLKENIVDSGSQWDDIKALRIRKYSMKDEYSDVPTQIGVIAQELEAAGMGGLVTEGADLDVDNNDLGTTTKQVTYSVLYMKAVKALQEAMERIESLESRVAALES